MGNVVTKREREPARDAISSSPGRDVVSATLIRKVDLCRGLFAFLVVAAHAIDACWAIYPESLGSLPPIIGRLLACTVQCGYYWVMGFFVISGYCIQLSVGRQIESGRFSTGNYLSARLTRIMPLYYVGLFFALVVEMIFAPIRLSLYPNGVDAAGWLSQLFFAQRFFATFGSFAASWTISYELIYYILFGVLAAASPRSRSRPAWVGMALCIVVGGLLQARYLTGHKDGLTLQVGLVFGLGTIWFMGALIAEHGPRLAQFRGARIVARIWPLFVVLSMALRGSGRCPDQVIYLILGVGFTLMMLRFQSQDVVRGDEPEPTPERLSAIARVVGLASYPTYLFHGPILLAVGSVMAHWGLIRDWRVGWLVLTVTGIGSGIFLGWVLERPVMAWRAGFLARRKSASVGRAVALAAK